MKRVFIIGNGFDLNLGWKTGYWNFIESPYCPIKDSHSPLALFLRQKTEIDRWYDLEAILREYASEGHEIDGHITNPCKKDEDFFNELRYDLAAYLRKEMEKEVNKESVAAKVLYAVVDSGLFTSIYTFNYTDLRRVARQLGIHKDFTYASVHGSVEANSIILGIEDKTNIRKGYSFLRKVFSEYYKSHPIRYDLQDCGEVVFFGHSLGDNDYPYFKDFFKAQSQCIKRGNSKRITIITKDNRSRVQILEQLRLMNDCETERLMNDNDFHFIMTDSQDQSELNAFIQHLNSEKNRRHIRIV